LYLSKALLEALKKKSKLEPSANIQALAKPEFPQKEIVNSTKKQNPISSIKESENKSLANDISVVLASPENILDTGEKVKTLAEQKMRKLKDFGELAEKASLFEFAMAVAGALFTGFQADWVSYMHEAFGEFSENHLVAAEEGHKEINPAVATLLKGVSFLFGIKNKEGKSLKTTNDFVKAQDKLIGALNMATSSLSGLVIAFKALPAAITGKQALDFSGKIPALHFISTKVFPTLNAGLMWMTGATKRRLAFDIQKEAYNADNKEEIDGAFTSGNQDYICGTNSLSLMLRQAVGAVSPRLANILEPVLASWIAVTAFKEGYGAYKEHEEDAPKFELNSVDKSAFGKGFYNLAKTLAKPMGVELPELNTLAA
jgi:hypothetical protein